MGMETDTEILRPLQSNVRRGTKTGVNGTVGGWWENAVINGGMNGTVGGWWVNRE